MNRSSLFLVVAVVAGTACADATSPSGSRLAPLIGPTGMATRVIQNEYLVVLNDNADVDAKVNNARGRGAEVVAEWKHALKGFGFRGGPDIVMALRTDPDVQYVEESQVYSVDVTQSPATWGIDRIDQRDRPLSNSFTYTRTASNVRAYIIDTGIRTTHNEFGGRATWGVNYADFNNTDCHGHGTHVAGTVGGTTYGVAKQVRLYAVKVLNCAGSGSTMGVVSGINWVRQQTFRPAVANMSLGGGASSSIDNAVTNAVNAGIVFAVAAGNSNANACNYSPARAAAAITVGATTSTDAKASYSNYGSCVDIHAPGSSITSAWRTGNSATNTISGTSMATPHVAGVAALYLSGNTGASAATVASALYGNASLNKISGLPAGTVNRLLFTNY